MVGKNFHLVSKEKQLLLLERGSAFNKDSNTYLCQQTTVTVIAEYIRKYTAYCIWQSLLLHHSVMRPYGWSQKNRQAIYQGENINSNNMTINNIRQSVQLRHSIMRPRAWSQKNRQAIYQGENIHSNNMTINNIRNQYTQLWCHMPEVTKRDKQFITV